MKVVSLIAVLSLAGVPAVADEDRSSVEHWLEAHRSPDQPKYFGEPIDLSLKDADLVEVLRSFAKIGGFNMVIQPGIRGKVTVELKGVPWDQALEQILKINNLGMEVTGGAVQVGVRSERTVQSLPLREVGSLARLPGPAPPAQQPVRVPGQASPDEDPHGLQASSMLTVSLELQHADPAVVAWALRRPEAGAPSPGGLIRAQDDKLVIRDTRPMLRIFGEVLAEIDEPAAAGSDPASLARRCIEAWDRLAR